MAIGSAGWGLMGLAEVGMMRGLKIMSRVCAVIGISDHGGWAVLVTVADGGTLLDRRRVELVDEDLPKIPHHSEAQRLPIDEAEALVERVRGSAERHAKLRLGEAAAGITGRANI